MKKKLISVILAIVMLACMIPLGTMTAFAEGSTNVDDLGGEGYFNELDMAGILRENWCDEIPNRLDPQWLQFDLYWEGDCVGRVDFEAVKACGGTLKAGFNAWGEYYVTVTIPEGSNGRFTESDMCFESFVTTCELATTEINLNENIFWTPSELKINGKDEIRIPHGTVTDNAELIDAVEEAICQANVSVTDGANVANVLSDLTNAWITVEMVDESQFDPDTPAEQELACTVTVGGISEYDDKFANIWEDVRSEITVIIEADPNYVELNWHDLDEAYNDAAFLSPEDYTTSSWNESGIEAAIEAAKDALDNRGDYPETQDSQDTIDELEEALTTATQALVERADVSELGSRIEYADCYIMPDDYVKDDKWTAYVTAYNTAKEIYGACDDDTSADQYQNEIDNAVQNLWNAINALTAVSDLSVTDQHIYKKTCETNDGEGAMMGHQDKIDADGVGRAIICLTQDDLDAITADYITVVGGDYGKETTITLDCAYTYFYAGDTKYEAGNESQGLGDIAAFLIIDCDLGDNPISGYGYYAVYNGDSEELIVDALYVK